MTDKKILVALGEAATAGGILHFLDEYILGENVEVTLCFFARDEHMSPDHDEVLDQLGSMCVDKSAKMRIRRLSADPHKDVERLSFYADLMVIPKSVLRSLVSQHEFSGARCAVIAVPDRFEGVENILLISDGSSKGVQGFKQFFQIFPHWINDPDFTLLRVLRADEVSGKSQDEALLLEYLKHYSDSVGILKVPEPLTAKLLRPLRYDAHTLVVGGVHSLPTRCDEDECFQPLHDDNSALYLPPQSV